MTTKKELIEMADKAAVEQFQKEGSLNPSWWGEKEDGEIVIIPPPPDNLPQFIIMQVVRATFRVKEVVRCVSMFEAYAAIMATQEEVDDRPASLADVPGRREIISYFAEDEEGILAACREIRRPSGELGLLEWREPRVGETTSGIMLGLLPTPDKRRAN